MRQFLLMVSAALAANLGGLPTAAQAQVVNATTHIHGLTCPFCSFGAKKKLKSVDGVKNVTVDVDQGVAVLHAQPGQSIQLRQISQATKNAGFEAGMIRAVAIGRVEQQGKHLHFVVKESDERFVLVPSETVPQEALRQQVGQSKDIQITGVWSIAQGETHAQLVPDAMTDL